MRINVPNGYSGNLKFDPTARGNRRSLLLDELYKCGTHRAMTDNTDSHLH
jgi:hypothetical protein